MQKATRMAVEPVFEADFRDSLANSDQKEVQNENSKW